MNGISFVMDDTIGFGFGRELESAVQKPVPAASSGSTRFHQVTTPASSEFPDKTEEEQLVASLHMITWLVVIFITLGLLGLAALFAS